MRLKCFWKKVKRPNHQNSDWYFNSFTQKAGKEKNISVNNWHAEPNILEYHYVGPSSPLSVGAFIFAVVIFLHYNNIQST